MRKYIYVCESDEKHTHIEKKMKTIIESKDKRTEFLLSYHILLSSPSLIFDNTDIILDIFLFPHLVSSNEYSYIHIYTNISSLAIIKRTIWKHLLPG